MKKIVQIGFIILLIFGFNLISPPKTKAQTVRIGTIVDVVTDGTYAYMASTEYGLAIANVSDPTHPIAVGSVSVGFAPTHLAKSGNLVVLIGDVAVPTGASVGAAVVDVTNPSTPVKLSSISGYTCAVAVSGQYAFFSDNYAGNPSGYLRIFSLANPAAPVQVANLSLLAAGYGYMARSLVISGNYVYLGTNGGVLVINVTNPSSPVYVSRFPNPNGSANNPWYWPLATAPGYLYAGGGGGASGNGIQIASIANPQSPQWLSQGISLGGNNTPQGIAVSGNYLFTVVAPTSFPPACYIEVINITNPGAMTFLTSRTLPQPATNVTISSHYAFVSDSSNGLVIFDISNPSSGGNPSVVATLKDVDAVSLNKTVDKTTASAGDILTYTTTYTNTATQRTNAVITDGTPANTTYKPGSAKLNNVSKTDAADGDEFSYSGGVATWNLGTLGPNTTGNVSFQVTVN